MVTKVIGVSRALRFLGVKRLEGRSDFENFLSLVLQN